MIFVHMCCYVEYILFDFVLLSHFKDSWAIFIVLNSWYKQPEQLFYLMGSVSGNFTYMYVEYTIYHSLFPKIDLGLAKIYRQIIG